MFPRFFDAALQFRPLFLAAPGRVCRPDPPPTPRLGGGFGWEIELFPRFFDAALQFRSLLLAAFGRVCSPDPPLNPRLGGGLGRSPQGLTVLEYRPCKRAFITVRAVVFAAAADHNVFKKNIRKIVLSY